MFLKAWQMGFLSDKIQGLDYVVLHFKNISLLYPQNARVVLFFQFGNLMWEKVTQTKNLFSKYLGPFTYPQCTFCPIFKVPICAESIFHTFLASNPL